MKDITQIFNNYYVYIYNYALKLSCHPDDAADITQDTFVKAWMNINTLKDENALSKWLRTICYHEFLMKIRKNQSDKQMMVEDWDKLEEEGLLLKQDIPLPEEEVIVAEEVKSLQNGCFLAMVRRLSLNQRIAFSLVDMFGLTTDQVAEILKISKGATKGLLYRARMNIDSFFSDHCDLIFEHNPCSCKAWIEFSSKRDQQQQRTKQLIRRLDFEKKGYQFDEIVRRKVLYLYTNMPEQKPSQDWYDHVIKIFANEL